MKTKERKEAARKRIKELQLLIADWDMAELDKQISAGDKGRTDYDPENIDNVKYFSQDEIACINFHLLELQDGIVINRAVPDELIQQLADTVLNWQKKQLCREVQMRYNLNVSGRQFRLIRASLVHFQKSLTISEQGDFDELIDELDDCYLKLTLQQ